MATVPVSFGTQQPEMNTFYGIFGEVKTIYPSGPSRGSFMPPSPPRARSRRHDTVVSSLSSRETLPPLAQPKGDVAPMEPHDPLRPMKSLAPPGLIAAGIPWLDYGPGCMPLSSSPRPEHRSLQRPPSPLPMAAYARRSISPSPVTPMTPMSPMSPIRRVVILPSSSVAPTRPLNSTPLPIMPSSARTSITRMTTTPSRPPQVRSVSRSVSPEPTRAPSPDLRGRPVSALGGLGALRAPGIAGEISQLPSTERRRHVVEEPRILKCHEFQNELERNHTLKKSCEASGSTFLRPPPLAPPLVLQPQGIFRRKLFSQELAGEAHKRSRSTVLVAEEFRWALHSGGRCGDDTIDTAAALSALRQLAYLYGLPALDADVARQCFGPRVDFDAFASALPTLLRRAQDPM
eukprot:Skav205115  [mRNA]  locus=scaffold1864:193818:199565:+ [translate_table: standard]